MAKKPNAIYEPGELNRVRGKLGNLDDAEAKRMAQILGGEVGMEKDAGMREGKHINRAKRETVELAIPGRRGKRPRRVVEIAGMDEEEDETSSLGESINPGDDPSAMLKTSYFERVKMDRYAAQFDFEIKNSLQVLISTLSIVGEPADYVNPRFVTRKMNRYYSKIEQLVTATRSLFPRNNARRSERMKKTSSFAYNILDIIRHWNIERIESEMTKLQAHPRAARVTEFAEIMRLVYKPLFILEKLSMDTHIKGAYKLLYKLIYVENPSEPKEKNQDLVRVALTSYAEVRRDVHYGLYPLIMKLISDRWIPYELLFTERRRRFMVFIGTLESEQIKPQAFTSDQEETDNLESIQEDIRKEQEAEKAGSGEEGEDPNDPEVIERKKKEVAAQAEKKAQIHGLSALESLFPEAGWDKLAQCPDMYPYFVNVYGLRRGYELIPATDPLQQVAVLMHILEDICVGLRYVTFGLVVGPDGKRTPASELIGETITHWRQYIDDGFSKEYLPRLTEYCRILEQSTETRSSPYAKRTLNELHWARRLYFLPYYKFESLGPPPFQKQDTVAVYSEVRNFRKYLTLIAAGIEQGKQRGGAEAKVICDGIENPWKQYNFEVPNPVSKRLDVLLGPGKRNNAALIFFALSTATVLDHLVNSETSWAYSERPSALFRSVNDAGVVPVFGIDTKLDADQIFKDAMKKRTGG